MTPSQFETWLEVEVSQLSNNIYSIFDKSERKAAKQMSLGYLWKLFIKNVAEQMKSITKTNISFNFYHLPTSTVFDRNTNTTIRLKRLTLFLLLFFSNFLPFNPRVFIFIVFCIPSNNCNKLKSILYGICLSVKSRHLELFCKIIIQLFSAGIFLGLW